MDLGGEMESGKVTEHINLIIHPFTRMSLATQLMLNTISTTQQQKTIELNFKSNRAAN